jgi:hypothetical protein
MANKTHFSPASEKGHFNGLVDEGEYLRQSLLYKQILPRTPSRPKTSAISAFSAVKNSCLCVLVAKIPRNLPNLRLINDLRSTKDYVRRNKLFLQNKAKFRKVKLNVTKVLTKDYDQLGQTQKGQIKRNFYYNSGL